MHLRSHKLIVLTIALVIIGGTALTAWLHTSRTANGNSWLEGILPSVFAESQSGLTLLGNVDVRQVDLSFKVGGRIGAMKFEEGDAVEAGQVVASLEKSDFEDEVRLARARVQVQEAALAKLKSGTRPEEIAQARALVDQREAELENAQLSFKRKESLAERGFSSHEVHENARAAQREAEARLTAAQEALKLAEAGPRQETIDEARAQLNANEISLNLIRRKLADADLIAPNDGVILTRVREPGAIVSTGETIYNLTLAAPIWVRTYVSEPDLGRIHPGMAAKVKTDSGGVYEGQIGFISPVAEFTPKSIETRQLRTSLVYRLRVIVSQPDNGLRQGMPVTVVLPSTKPTEGEG